MGNEQQHYMVGQEPHGLWGREPHGPRGQGLHGPRGQEPPLEADALWEIGAALEIETTREGGTTCVGGAAWEGGAGAEPPAPAGLLYKTMESPLGALLLVQSDGMLMRVAFSVEDHVQVLEHYERTHRTEAAEAGEGLDGLAAQLDAYFGGERSRIVYPCAFGEAEFTPKVLSAVRDIPYGGRRTYTEVAAAAGRPSSVRAVGTVCSQNPLPLVVPCHRVVKHDGSAGHYVAGSAAKRWLLQHEASRAGTTRPGS